MRRGEAVDAVACIADDQSRRVHEASAEGIFDLGRRMRAARLRQGWAQEDLGSAVGASSSTISRMELGGGASVPLGLWVAVGDVLGLDILAADADRPQVDAVAIRRLAARGGWAPTGAWAAVRQTAGVPDPAEQALRTGELERPSRRRRSSMRWLNALSEPLAQAPAWRGVVWLAPAGTDWLPVA